MGLYSLLCIVVGGLHHAVTGAVGGVDGGEDKVGRAAVRSTGG